MQALPLPELYRVAAAKALQFPGVRLIVLFGSAARGSARSDSDADIGLLGAEFWQQLELGSTLAAVLAREPHVVDLQQAPEALAYDVARTGILLFERQPFAWAQFQARAATRFFDFQPARERFVAGARQRVAREIERARKAENG